MFKYIWLFLFLAVGVFTLKAEFYRSDYAEFDVEVFRFYYFTCLVLAIALIWTWFKFYRANRKALAILPIPLPLLFLGLVIFTTIQRDKKQNVPAFLVAGFETIQVQFRIDSTYRIKESGEFSGESYYGKFKLRGDTILLDRSYDLIVFFSETLLINKGGIGISNNSNTYIFQLDKNGTVIDSLIKLPVLVDKRNNH